jgi:thiol-disulfide isomerase/thioredoxin
MKKLKSILLFMLPVLAIITACQGKSEYLLKGVIQNAANLQVVLDQSHFNRENITIGRATCDATGKFDIKLEKPWEEGLYRLSVGAKRMYFILDGKENVIEFNSDLNTMDRLEGEIKGSATMECYAGIIRDLIKNQVKSPEEGKAIVKKGCTTLMQAFLLAQVLGSNPSAFMEDFRTMGTTMKEKMPNSRYTTDFQGMIAQVEKAISQQQSTELIKEGQPAPEIALPGVDGKKVLALSSLKGKVVLLDFWASWCGPCRRENPHVVEIYNKYKDKGFEIFSVSLDGADPRMKMSPEQMQAKEKDGREKWIAAIKQDGLIWENHVSDLKHWGSAAAALYGVTSIPKTFLIGKDGNIIAINPRQNLEQELLKVL